MPVMVYFWEACIAVSAVLSIVFPQNREIVAKRNKLRLVDTVKGQNLSAMPISGNSSASKPVPPTDRPPSPTLPSGDQLEPPIQHKPLPSTDQKPLTTKVQEDSAATNQKKPAPKCDINENACKTDKDFTNDLKNSAATNQKKPAPKCDITEDASRNDKDITNVQKNYAATNQKPAPKCDITEDASKTDKDLTNVQKNSAATNQKPAPKCNITENARRNDKDLTNVQKNSTATLNQKPASKCDITKNASKTDKDLTNVQKNSTATNQKKPAPKCDITEDASRNDKDRTSIQHEILSTIQDKPLASSSSTLNPMAAPFRPAVKPPKQSTSSGCKTKAHQLPAVKISKARSKLNPNAKEFTLRTQDISKQSVMRPKDDKRSNRRSHREESSRTSRLDRGHPENSDGGRESKPKAQNDSEPTRGTGPRPRGRVRNKDRPDQNLYIPPIRALWPGVSSGGAAERQ